MKMSDSASRADGGGCERIASLRQSRILAGATTTVMRRRSMSPSETVYVLKIRPPDLRLNHVKDAVLAQSFLRIANRLA